MSKPICDYFSETSAFQCDQDGGRPNRFVSGCVHALVLRRSDVLSCIFCNKPA